MSELSIGVAIAVTQSVWARIVPLSTRDSAIFVNGGWKCASSFSLVFFFFFEAVNGMKGNPKR